MEINDKDIKRFMVIFLVLGLAVLVFFLLKPIILSIIGGLILAYAFFPIYKRLVKRVKSKNLSATFVSIIAIIVILLPLYFLTPLMINQVFGLFQAAQKIDFKNIIMVLFSSAPETFIVQMTAVLNNIISKVTAAVLTALTNLLLEFPTLLLNFIIIAFVFFFTLRDSDKLGEFVSALSPLNKVQEKKLVQQFKDVTNSVVYGQIAAGLMQGLVAGIGLFIFGVPKALVLTVLAVILSIIPLIGPSAIWIPATIYVFLQGNTPRSIVYLLYNLFLVSYIDNILRVYIVTKRTRLSQVLVLVGMIGGLYIFGILGLILGPLLLVYFITFLNAYKDNTLSSLFKTEKDVNA